MLTFQGYRYLSTEKDLKEELGHQSYDTSNFAADETDVNKERSIAAVEGASFNFNFFPLGRGEERAQRTVRTEGEM